MSTRAAFSNLQINTFHPKIGGKKALVANNVINKEVGKVKMNTRGLGKENVIGVLKDFPIKALQEKESDVKLMDVSVDQPMEVESTPESCARYEIAFVFNV